MPYVMMQIGSFQFSLDTAAYKSFRRQSSFRWVSVERHSRHAALQYTGPGEDTISLSGTIFPHFRGGLEQVEAMRNAARGGDPLILVDGQGVVHGKWVIESVVENSTAFFSDGASRQMDFTMQLKYYGEA